MSERGVFAIDRGIWTNPSFSPEPFTEREAFMWLIGEAAWRPREKRVNYQTVMLRRGQACASVRFMAESWGWHRSRVERYLARIEREGMISRDTSETPR